MKEEEMQERCEKIAKIVNDCQIEILEYLRSKYGDKPWNISSPQWVDPSNPKIQWTPIPEIIREIESIDIPQWCKENKNTLRRYEKNKDIGGFFSQYIEGTSIKLLSGKVYQMVDTGQKIEEIKKKYYEKLTL